MDIETIDRMDIETIDREGCLQLQCNDVYDYISDFDIECEESDLGRNDEDVSEDDLVTDLGRNDEDVCEDNLVTDLGRNDEDVSEADSVTPTLGMLFTTQDEAFKFYNKYALRMAFGIRKSSSIFSRTDKSICIGKKFVCNKEGRKKTQTTTTVQLDVVNRREIRMGCNAAMIIRLTDFGEWIVNTLVLEHNYEMSTPSKSSKHRSHRKIHKQTIVQNLMTRLHGHGLSNVGIARVINTLEPDPDHLLIPQQVHEHLRIARKNNLGKSCGMIVNHFLNKKAKDDGFYFNIEVADDYTLRSVFWADKRSQDSYKKFSNVIIFDVTYRTNNFSLPFAPFTGINHHRQSSLFGCALLADETEETFVWLFDQWLTCMGRIQPAVIITDQDAAMGNAIKRVFPNTLHRYCDRHLDKNIAENLRHLTDSHGPEFEEYFNELRSSETPCQADRLWNELTTKYKLNDKSSLPKLWGNRKSWLPCYLKDTFFAGARSSQRAESINSFFDTYVNARTPLHEFVVQYDKALASRRRAEEDADFHTMNSKPVAVLGWSLEEDAGKLYTSALFNLFHKELKDSIAYWPEKIRKEGTVQTFKVGRQAVDKSKWKVVTYDSSGDVVFCECKRFENIGLLCKHVLCIFWRKRIEKIPDQYVLKRWTIQCRFQSVDLSFEKDVEASEVDRELLWGIRFKITKVLEEAYKSPMFAEAIDKYLTRKLAEVHIVSSQDHETGISQFSSNTIPQISIRDTTEAVRTKGRPRQVSRLQGSLEISQDEAKDKKRTCGFCGEKGHYRTGCPKAKELEKNNKKGRESSGQVS